MCCDDDCAESVFDGPSLGRIAFEAHVAAGLVVVGLVLQESPEEMTFARSDNVISEFSVDDPLTRST